MNIEDTIDEVVADISGGDFSTTPSAIINEVVYLDRQMDAAHHAGHWDLFDRLVERQVGLVENYFRNQPTEQAA
jgi:hypothetical protein